MAYDRVRFIGYAVPTTPADMIPVGDPNGTGAIAGTYRAAEDFAADIATRAAALKVAVDTAKAVLPGDEPGVLNVFVAPEFFWHGTMGPYPHKPDEPDPGAEILDLLERTFPAAEYPDFLLVLGTVVSAEVADVDTMLSTTSARARNDIVRTLGESWNAADGPLADVIFDTLVNFVKNCHAYPLMMVRNRALIISTTEVTGVQGEFTATALTTEKYFDSNEDFLLWDVTGRPVITEQMTAYAMIDISAGDLKRSPRDPYAIFRLPEGEAPGGDRVRPLDIAVEVCLDHAADRIRKSIPHNRWPEPDGGIDLHLLPSCGMQVHHHSVGARGGGWVFNCDGQYALGHGADAGDPQRGILDRVPSAYADYVDPADPVYGAHTQLARVRTSAVGSARNGTDALDATFDPVPDVDVRVIAVEPSDGFAACFAGGPGAVHIYGLETPLPLRR